MIAVVFEVLSTSIAMLLAAVLSKVVAKVLRGSCYGILGSS